MSVSEYKPRHLFSLGATLQLIEMVAKDPLLAFDFDGTLAPLREQPGQVYLSPKHSMMLQKLCEDHKIAILSGRGISDLQNRISFNPHYLVGNHGVEHRDINKEFNSLIPFQISDELNQFRTHLNPMRPQLLAEGVNIEDKTHSIALHYRAAKNIVKVNGLFKKLKSYTKNVVSITRGKEVLNISAKSSPDKLQALKRILKMSNKKYAIYFGDDTNDEVIFRAKEPEYFSVMVGKTLNLSADYYVDNEMQVYEALEVISEIKRNLKKG